MSGLEFEIDAVIRERQLFAPGQKILLAVSGGLDSMVLLDVLNRLAPSRQWTLCVAHFNHQLRGRASDADERLVRSVAAKLGLKCLVGRANVRKRQTQHGESTEMAARFLRHRFLARTAERLGIGSVALAHHGDDQVELFFLRLLRGAGGGGLAGMKWASPSPSSPKIRLIRPLLSRTKAELLDYARQNGVEWREDSSNATLEPLRNRIRHHLLPLLRESYLQNVDARVLELMKVVSEETDFAAQAARGWLADGLWPEVGLEPASRCGAASSAGESPISECSFDMLHTAVQRQVILKQLVDLGINPRFDLIESVRREPDRPFTFQPGWTIRREQSGHLLKSQTARFSFDRRQIAVAFEGSKGQVEFDGLTLCWRFVSVSEVPVPGNLKRRDSGLHKRVSTDAAPQVDRPQHVECFDADKLGGGIVLRHWQPGDRFQPIGMHGPVKLQDWLTNQKIPRAQRHRLVVAATRSQEIFWVEGLRIGEGCKIDQQTRRCMIWFWERS